MSDAVAADRRESTLADGAQLPLLGLGVWQVPNGRECVDALRWALELGHRHIERDIPLIAKSTHRDRIAENAQIFDFTLSNADMAELDALDRTGGTPRALERRWW